MTGASAGIGAATARGLAAAGFTVVFGARRVDRIQQIAGGLKLPSMRSAYGVGAVADSGAAIGQGALACGVLDL